MPAQVPPAVKIVVAATAQPWTGAVYPTQATKGDKQQFESPEELLAAIARLTSWQLAP